MVAVFKFCKIQQQQWKNLPFALQYQIIKSSMELDFEKVSKVEKWNDKEPTSVVASSDACIHQF